MGLTHLTNHPVEAIANLYLQQAESLSEEQWQGGLYLALDGVLSLLDEERDEDAEALLVEIEEHVANVFESYETSYVVAGELSAMAVLAHRWMKEAVDHLFEAISVIANAPSLEEAEGALELAEWGCRLLTIVGEVSAHQEVEIQEAA